MFGAEGSLVVKTEILGAPRVVDLSDSGEVEGDEEEGMKKCVDIKSVPTERHVTLTTTYTSSKGHPRMSGPFSRTTPQMIGNPSLVEPLSKDNPRMSGTPL
ncbi:hypothetical protein GBAR_LOCUS30126 [Geodia barretti]|uniref:Uncharacterized protein n=1 Tax=Geodia barretti TaxID=519541 RepID=A0AA35XF71_GEOBA|nr:hypothetical protein GBAR_LOCUS30126 [Geodia barretti]